MNCSCWMVPAQMLEKMSAGLPVLLSFAASAVSSLSDSFHDWLLVLVPTLAFFLPLSTYRVGLPALTSCLPLLLVSTKNHSDILFMLLCYWQKACFPLLCALYLSYEAGGGWWEPAGVWHGMSPPQLHATVQLTLYHFIPTVICVLWTVGNCRNSGKLDSRTRKQCLSFSVEIAQGK